MSNHIPFLFLKSGNISRKFVTKKMRSCDKNFGQLQIAVVMDIPKKKVENKLYYVKQKLRKMMEK